LKKHEKGLALAKGFLKGLGVTTDENSTKAVIKAKLKAIVKEAAPKKAEPEVETKTDAKESASKITLDEVVAEIKSLGGSPYKKDGETLLAESTLRRALRALRKV